MNIPQFGEPLPGRDYPDRPAAFAVIPRGDEIAVVRVDLGGGRSRLDLPGGGLDPGETAGEAAARECGEEAGLEVAVEDAPFTCADHFFVNQDGETNNTRGQFFAGTLLGEATHLKIEDDHELEWMAPQHALLVLSRESHVWALTAWLRRGFAPGRANG